MSTSWWQKGKSDITKVSRLHPLGNMDICTKFYSSPSNTVVDIRSKAKIGITTPVVPPFSTFELICNFKVEHLNGMSL